jgi:CheY-like chemotaxis protein
MNQLTTISNQFSFPARELPQQLLEHIQGGETGYWQHQFDRLSNRSQTFEWNLGIVNGQILYSGNRIWSIQSLMRVMQRYIPRTRHEAVISQIDALKRQAVKQSLTPAQLIAQMKQLGLIDDAQLLKALQTKILNDLDIYLLMGSGEAKFIAEPNLVGQLPLEGFSPISLLNEAKQRQQRWYQVKQQVPSMNMLPNLDQSAMAAANLPPKQQQRIEKLVQSGKHLNEIADEMAKDTLEIAEMFAKLVKMGVVNFTAPPKNTPATIMVIDDSPLMLTQFQHWVSALGYPVVVCQQADLAIATITQVKPAAVFIDINMPEISGFELVKLIRQQPELAAIPLAILTGEQKLSNKWRAQWSGCEFLTKPLTTASVAEFQTQLEELLPKLLATTGTAQINQNLNN